MLSQDGGPGGKLVGGGSLVCRRVMVVTGGGVLAWRKGGWDGAWEWE